MPIDRAQNFVNFASSGRLQPSGDLSTTPDQLAALFDHIRESGKPSLTIYFHGGLVSEEKGLQLLNHLYAEIEADFDSYPLFFLWESGWLEVLQSELQEIQRDGRLFDIILPKLLKYAARLARQLAVGTEESFIEMDEAAPLTRELEQERLSLLTPAAFTALDAMLPGGETAVSLDTATAAAALTADLEDDTEANQILAAILAAGAEESTEESFGKPTQAQDFLSADLLAELRAQTAAAASVTGEGGEEEAFITAASAWGFAGKVLVAIGRRFARGTHHGFLATVLEELYRHLYLDKIGRFLWDGMKQSAANAYADNPAGPATADFHGGALFLELLRDHIATHGPLKINLIGHSAGSIHICHFVQKAAALLEPEFRFENVIFLAPACDFDLFVNSIVRHEAQINTFRLFTMDDERERADTLVPLLPFIYPHSILYLVSGLLEQVPDRPLLGLARHLLREQTGDPVRKGQEYLRRSDGIVLAPARRESAPPGARADFHSHAGAKGPNHDFLTLSSLAHLIRVPLPEPDESAPLDPMADDLIDSMPPDLQNLFQPAQKMRFVTPQEQQSAADREAKAPSAMSGAESAADPFADPISDPFADPILETADGEGSASMAAIDDPFSGMEEAIIGDNDLVDHGLIEGLLALGRSVARVNAPAIAGFTQVPPSDREAAWQRAAQTGQLRGTKGTGWVFGAPRRVILTNNHVLPLPQAAGRATLEFGYERDGRTGTIGVEKVLRLDPEKLFITSVNMRFDGLDYTVVALREPAPEEFGFLEFSSFDTAEFANKVYIVQHPNGEPKKYIVNNNPIINRAPDGRYFTYASDTMRGSSGAPLFDDNLNLIGIHHLGNHKLQLGDKEIFTNLGSRMEAVLRDMAQQLQIQGWDEAQVKDWFGDGSLLAIWKELVSA
jgi:hypothetical protein